MVAVMSTRKLGQLIKRLAGGTIFRITFTKRSNGEQRVMVCRLNATAYITGEGARYDAAAKGLLPVFDVQARGWRSVPLDAIINIKVRGVTYDGNGCEVS